MISKGLIYLVLAMGLGLIAHGAYIWLQADRHEDALRIKDDRITALDAQVRTLTADRDSAESAAAAQRAARESIEAELDKRTAEDSAEIARQQAAIAALQAERGDLERTHRTFLAKYAAGLRNPDCAALRAINLRSVCPLPSG